MPADVISLVQYKAFKDELEKTALVGALAKGIAKIAPKVVGAVGRAAKKAPKLLPKAKPLGARGGFARAKSLPKAKPLGARGGLAPRRAPPPPSRGKVQPPTMSEGNLAKQRAARASKSLPEATPLGKRQSGQKFVPKGRVLGQRDVVSSAKATRDLPKPTGNMPKAAPLGKRQSGRKFVPSRPTKPLTPPTRLRPKMTPPKAPPVRLRPAA